MSYPFHATIFPSFLPYPASFGQEEPTYSALWGNNKAFDEVIISPAMLNEHMPHMVMEGLNKVGQTSSSSSSSTSFRSFFKPREGEPTSLFCYEEQLIQVDAFLTPTRTLPWRPFFIRSEEAGCFVYAVQCW